MGVYTFRSFSCSKHVLRIVTFLSFIISSLLSFFELHQVLATGRRQD